MTAILGISALYHDAAAALIVDGRIVAAAQEERFSRVKNDRRFPTEAIRYCLQEGGLTDPELDFVAFYEKPLLKFDRVLETHAAGAPLGFRAFSRSIPAWLKENLHVAREVQRQLPGFNRRLLYAEHHESHAASAFFPSPFEEAAILTVDGVGEWATATIGAGRGNQIELLSELRFPHSLGLLYSACTHYCGFEVDSGEYKLMGLAPYGEPSYVDVITDRIVDVKPDGSLWLDMSYFDYCHGLRMTSARFHRLFGAPPRKPDEPLTQAHLNLAASVQKLTETILLRMARHVHERTGMRKLCLAGGVALNAVANGRILAEGPFDEVWIQPAAGDAGGALGAALLIWHQLLGNRRPPSPSDAQHGSLLGPAFESDQIRRCLTGRGAVFREAADEPSLCRKIAGLLADQKVVGWCQGRMEFGPRALGNRSILADPRDSRMQSLLNQKIKFRESFRPFAPAVLGECATEYFKLPHGHISPYMLLVADVCESKRLAVVSEPPGLAKLSAVRSQIPAVTHVDYSSRVQTVDATSNPLFAMLLKEFQQQTGCPLLVNTSFNVRDRPIVCTPEDAYECFMATDLDVLVLGSFVLMKELQLRAEAREPMRISTPHAAASSALLTGRRFVELDEAVTPRQLKTFGVGLLVATVALVAIALWTNAWRVPFWVLACATGASAAAFYARPGARQTIYRTFTYASFPLSWLSSTAALALIYYLVLTPTALLMRGLGRDALQGRRNRDTPSWWRERRRNADSTRHLRPF